MDIYSYCNWIANRHFYRKKLHLCNRVIISYSVDLYA